MRYHTTPCLAMPCHALPCQTKHTIRPSYRAQNPAPLANNSLHAQPLQEAAQILFPDLDNARFEAVHAHARACLADDFLKCVAEPVASCARRVVIFVGVAVAFVGVVVIFFLGVIVNFILVKAGGFKALALRFALLLQLCFFLFVCLPLLLLSSRVSGVVLWRTRLRRRRLDQQRRRGLASRRDQP